MKNIITIGLMIIGGIFLLWLFGSWAEIVLKNLTHIPIYSPFNLLMLVCQ